MSIQQWQRSFGITYTGSFRHGRIVQYIVDAEALHAVPLGTRLNLNSQPDPSTPILILPSDE